MYQSAREYNFPPSAAGESAWRDKMWEGEAGINMKRVVVLNIAHASGRSRLHNLQPSSVCFDTGRSSVAKQTGWENSSLFLEGTTSQLPVNDLCAPVFPAPWVPKWRSRLCNLQSELFMPRVTRQWMFLYQLSPRQSQAVSGTIGHEICPAYQDSVST